VRNKFQLFYYALSALIEYFEVTQGVALCYNIKGFQP